MDRRTFRRQIGTKGRTPDIATTLPTNAEISGITEYIAAQFNRTALCLEDEEFRAVAAAVDALYNEIRHSGQGISDWLGRVLIVCHQALYSAIAATARGVPLDGAAATRRAIESARTALAIHLDTANADRFVQFQTRMERWKARTTNTRPPELKCKYECLKGHRVATALHTQWGMLSDSEIHFSPEFMSQLSFRKFRASGAGQLHSEYLQSDLPTLIRHMVQIAVIHLLILEALDECADGGFKSSPAFVAAVEDLRATVRPIAAKYRLTSDEDDPFPDAIRRDDAEFENRTNAS